MAQRPIIVLLLCLIPGLGVAQAASATAESAALKALVKQGVDPALNQMSKTALALQTSVGHLCQQASEAALDQARQDWRSAYLARRYAAPFLFGPAANLERYIGQWPVE